MSETNDKASPIDDLVMREDKEILDWIEEGTNITKIISRQAWTSVTENISVREHATNLMNEQGV